MSREAQPAYVKGQRLWLVDDATGAFDTEVLVEQVAAVEVSGRRRPLCFPGRCRPERAPWT
eukprot:6320372-Pyramimonas_sp.AAC.1